MKAVIKRDSRRLVTTLLGVFVLVGTACAKDAPQDVLKPEGAIARKADGLWDLTFAVAVIVFFIVEGLLVYTIVKFRQKPGREAAQFHGHTRTEVVLTVVPALLLAGIAIPTVKTIFDVAEHPDNALEVTVIAHQFWWEYEYPEEGIVTANEMHIPTGRPVYLTLKGATSDQVTGDAEVIHSFWVPRLGGTQDVVPGRENFLLIQADEPDTYLGQCKEFCGLGHANMRLKVIAHAPDDFETWVASQQQAPPSAEGDAAEGAQLFSEGQFANGPACASCHSVDPAQGGTPGPNLAHFGSRTTFAGALVDNTTENLSAWLANPAAVKDGARMPDLGLTQDQIDKLIAYLQSLK